MATAVKFVFHNTQLQSNFLLKFALSTPDVIVFLTSQQGWAWDSRVEGERE